MTMTNSVTDTTIVTIPAPAKINLYLTVTGRRPDGYHLVDSLVAFTTLGDVLTIKPDRKSTRLNSSH